MMLEAKYFGNTVQDWAIAIAVATIIFFILKIGRRVVVKRLGAFARQTATQIDDLAVEILKKTKFFFFVVIALYAGSQPLVLPPGGLRAINGLLILGTLLQTAFWGNAVIVFILGRAVKQRVDTDAAGATTLSAIGIVAKLVLWSVLLLLALDNLGVNITGLVAGLGIGGIAVALALQNILGDLFASLSIALDKPFVIGDFVIVDQLLGTVEHIGLKTTRIRSLSGEQIVFSNADLLKSRIRNFKRMYERRVVFSIGVTYQTPLDKLSVIPAMLKEIVEAQSSVRFDRAHFKEYGDSSLNFEVVYYVMNPDYNVYMDIQQAINLEIFRRFLAGGIQFAYPTRTLHIQQTLTSSVDETTQSGPAE